MKTSKYAVIHAKYRSPLYGGGYCKPGDLVVMFPRNIYVGVDPETEKKQFVNSYVKLNDLSKFPEFRDVKSGIERQYGINTDTYGKLRTIWRR